MTMVQFNLFPVVMSVFNPYAKIAGAVTWLCQRRGVRNCSSIST
jgi:hypothetical protein